MKVEIKKNSYIIGGEEFSRVTSITGQLDKSNALIPWALNCMEQYITENMNGNEPVLETVSRAKREYRTVSQTACDIGSEIHEKIRVYIQNGIDATGEMREEVMNGFLAFLEWEKSSAVKWLESEKLVVNRTLGYAGTFDALAEISGSVYLIDFKSSKAIYDEYFLQLSAYNLALADMEEKPAEKLAILRLDKETGIPEFFDISEVYGEKGQHMFEWAFISLAQFKRFFAEGKKCKAKKKGGRK